MAKLARRLLSQGPSQNQALKAKVSPRTLTVAMATLVHPRPLRLCGPIIKFTRMEALQGVAELVRRLILRPSLNRDHRAKVSPRTQSVATATMVHPLTPRPCGPITKSTKMEVQGRPGATLPQSSRATQTQTIATKTKLMLGSLIFSLRVRSN